MARRDLRTALALAGAVVALAVGGAMLILAPSGALAAGTATSSAAAPAPAIAGGWGAVSGYIGKFQVKPAGTSGAARIVTSPGAGVFSLVVRTAAQLGGASAPVASGQLVTFLRKVKSTEPLAPSGILSLFGPSGSRILYLTDLALHGTRRVATVDGGSFLGVPIGRFSATPGPDHRLDATISASGLGTVRVRLIDFRAAPPSS